jgi:RimJ/RimL family protein N-acetyltransferase
VNAPDTKVLLRAATDSDLLAVSSWIPDEEANRLWGGPNIRFPHTLECLVDDLDFRGCDSVALIGEARRLLGFGQLLDRSPETVHLARVIVSPDLRGQGLGRILCRLLIDRGLERFGRRSFSLNVYRQNRVALRTYESLGFRPFQPSSDGPEMMLMQLTLPLAPT